MSPLIWTLKSRRNFIIFDAVLFSLVMAMTFFERVFPSHPFTRQKWAWFAAFMFVDLLGGVIFAWAHWWLWGRTHRL